MILYMYIATGQGQTAPRGQNFDVNRNVLSLHSFVTSLNKMSLKPDFIQFSSCFNKYIAPGDKILMSTENPYHLPICCKLFL